MTAHDNVHCMLHQQGLIGLPEALHLLEVTWGGGVQQHARGKGGGQASSVWPGVVRMQLVQLMQDSRTESPSWFTAT
jgi:hypothetical protein